MADASRTISKPRIRDPVPPRILEIIREKNRARRLAHRTGQAADRREANRLTRQVRNNLIEFRNEQWDSKIRSLTTENNSFWRMSKALRNDRKPLPPIHGTRGLVFTDAEKAEAFADSL
ncbi:hypothetical protein BDFB_015180, partial [Asbolus verrucosus]